MALKTTGRGALTEYENVSSLKSIRMTKLCTLLQVKLSIFEKIFLHIFTQKNKTFFFNISKKFFSKMWCTKKKIDQQSACGAAPRITKSIKNRTQLIHNSSKMSNSYYHQLSTASLVLPVIVTTYNYSIIYIYVITIHN